MLPHSIKSQLNLGKGIGFSVGVAVLLGSNSASAFVGLPLQISQSNSTAPDVVVDTQSNRSASTSSSTSSDDPRFTCENENGNYVVMYHPEDQSYEAYPWAAPQRLGGGWTAQKRCNAISERLESYRPDGLLELRTSTENGYNTLCATTERVADCRIVLTVPPGQDPVQTRNLVFENLLTADSGQQTQGVNTFRGSGEGEGIINQVGQILNGDLSSLRGNRQRQSDGINLQPFLAPSDGGTGEQLPHNQPKNSTSPRLNPDSFR